MGRGLGIKKISAHVSVESVSVNVADTYIIKMVVLWFVWTFTEFNFPVTITIGY